MRNFNKIKLIIRQDIYAHTHFSTPHDGSYILDILHIILFFHLNLDTNGTASAAFFTASF